MTVSALTVEERAARLRLLLFGTGTLGLLLLAAGWWLLKGTT